jgi:drug/metabolite transporter (DMT)-like permease
MHHYKALDVIRILFTIGFFIAFPFCWQEFNEIPWHLFMPLQWMVLALVVIGGTFCAYLFNIYGIKILGASVSGSYIYSQPFFATFIAMFFLHEKLDLYKIIAAICIFSGVYLANKYSSAPVDSINE